MKTIIWSLFDSETAITQKLNSDKYKVFSIGLPSSSAVTDNFIKVDLSRKSCIKKLSKLPTPDIIFASPPCETWVGLSVGNVRFYKRNYNEYNLYWQRDFKPNDFSKKHRSLRLLGQKTAYWTYKIIEKFNPRMWCIENGSSSLIFKYLNKYHGLIGYKNKCEYSSYDHINFSKKPTTIFSNLKMNLAKNNIYSNNIIEDNPKKGKNIFKSYADRSRVPIQLYEHILKHYENEAQLSLKL